MPDPSSPTLPELERALWEAERHRSRAYAAWREAHRAVKHLEKQVKEARGVKSARPSADKSPSVP